MRVAHGAGNNDEGQKAGGQDAERSHRQAPPGAEAEVRESRWRGLQPYSLGGETRKDATLQARNGCGGADGAERCINEGVDARVGDGVL